MVDDYWEASKRMLMEDDFLNSLREYNRDNIDQSIIKKIKVGFAGLGTK
jgi:dynein heavy chain